MSSPTDVPATTTANSPAPTPVRVVTNLDPATVFAALGCGFRWELWKLMARGQKITASDMATRFRREFDGVSKHLRVMRDAGLVVVVASEDRRQALYDIPAAFRATPGVIDYGFCQIPIPTATDLARQ